MKRYFIFFCCMTFCIMSHAQVKYGVEAGYALSAPISISPALRQPLNGAQIDAFVDYRSNKIPLLGLKVGLGYKFAGYSSSKNHLLCPSATSNEYKESINEHVLYIPIRLTLNYDVTENITLRILTGPCVSYNWQSSKFEHSGSIPESGVSKLNEVYYPVNCSWGIGIACVYKHLSFETAYDMGLYNRTRRDHASYDMNTFYDRDFYVTIGYIF